MLLYKINKFLIKYILNYGRNLVDNVGLIVNKYWAFRLLYPKSHFFPHPSLLFFLTLYLSIFSFMLMKDIIFCLHLSCVLANVQRSQPAGVFVSISIVLLQYLQGV